MRSGVQSSPAPLGIGDTGSAAAPAVAPTSAGKQCPKCSRHLPREAFNRNRTHRDGLQSYCRECYRTKVHADPRHVARSNERSRAYRAANPDKRRAHHAVERAINAGKMVRGFCECCGNEKADAHHWRGYDHPLDVQWLCRSCHVTVEPRRGVA